MLLAVAPLASAYDLGPGPGVLGPPPMQPLDPSENPIPPPGVVLEAPPNGNYINAGESYLEPGAFGAQGCPPPIVPEVWHWQVLPDGLIYHSYMASVHEPRISGVAFWDQNGTPFFDVALGGRVGVLRFGTSNNDWPNGWQLDLEGVAFPRLNFDANWDLDLADYRFGVPLTYGAGPWRYKFAYYHLSSHLGDEYAIRNPGSLADRINYSRDSWALGVSYFTTPALRLYTEVSWAFHHDGGAEPWEVQFGADFAQPGPTGIHGTPFAAVNGHLREAVDFGGNFVAQAGWLWRGDSGRTLRMGAQYYNGKSNQYEFFDEFEQQIGFGIWYDQ